MSPQTSFLISCQCYFSHTPAVTERSNQRDADFRSKAGQRRVFPRPNPTSFLQFITPSAVLIQQFIINIIFRRFISGIQARAQPHSPGGTSEACRTRGWEGMCSWGAGACEAGLAAVPGCSAVTQVSLRAAWCPACCRRRSAFAFLRSWVHSEFLRFSWHSIPWDNVLIQMFISQCVGVGVNAGKYKTCDTLW